MEVPSQASEESSPGVNELEDPASSRFIPQFGYVSKAFCVLAGFFLPIICFGLSAREEPDASSRWQSGALEDMLAQLLGGPPTYAYYPLLLFSMVSLLVLIFDEAFLRKHLWLHFGIYGGVPLALMFGVLLGAVQYLPDVSSVVGYCLIGLVVFSFHPFFCHLVENLRTPPGESLLVVVSSLMLVICVVVFPLGIALTLYFSPWITASAYLIASIRLFRLTGQRRFSLLALLLSMTWLSALGATWRAAWTRALVAYSQLPTEPPQDCFIVAAASRGHVRVVGSWKTRSGRIVNRQLLRFKAFELMLAAVAPSVHRRLRSIYNRVGPPIARRIRSPLAADVVFVLLKPLEVLTAVAESVLRVQAKRAEEATPLDSP